MSRRTKQRKRHAAPQRKATQPLPSPAAKEADDSLAPPPVSLTREVKPEAGSPEAKAAEVMGAVLDSLATSLGVEPEHREHPRVALHVEIDLHSESHFFTGLSGDVSEGGLFVQTYRPLRVGDEVDVSFDLEDRMVQARALVAWSRDRSATCEPGFGLSFRGLTDEQRETIHAFCAKREPLYYDAVG
ncbi:MAG TPA: TIGR02266 family protein [Polyangiaceae bacterium]